MAIQSTKESWSALYALLDGPDFFGSILQQTEMRDYFTPGRTKSEDVFVWNASKPSAANPSTQTFVQYQVLYSITPPSIPAGTQAFLTAYLKRWFKENGY